MHAFVRSFGRSSHCGLRPPSRRSQSQHGAWVPRRTRQPFVGSQHALNRHGPRGSMGIRRRENAPENESACSREKGRAQTNPPTSCASSTAFLTCSQVDHRSTLVHRFRRCRRRRCAQLLERPEERGEQQARDVRIFIDLDKLNQAKLRSEFAQQGVMHVGTVNGSSTQPATHPSTHACTHARHTPPKIWSRALLKHVQELANLQSHIHSRTKPSAVNALIGHGGRQAGRQAGSQPANRAEPMTDRTDRRLNPGRTYARTVRTLVPWLMNMASRARSPVDPDFLAFSDPDKSTKLSRVHC